MPGLVQPAALYDRAVRELAAAASGAGSLPRPDASAACSNPMCGDEVRIELALDADAGRITRLAHRTRGCLLCRASASLLAQLAGQCSGDAGQLQGMHEQLAALLGGEGSDGGNFAMFAPVASRPSRQACVLLPWQALEQALAKSA